MSKSITLDYQGEQVSGQLLDFKTESEDWNKYKTEDGSIVKVKVVVTKIIRADKTTPAGEPLYIVNSTTLVDADVSDEVKALHSKNNEQVSEN